MPARVLVQS